MLWHKGHVLRGDKDMADQNEAKTKTIGFLPIEKVQTLKGWEAYVDKSTKLSALRTEAQKAKNSVRDALKERLSENGDMDFTVEGDRIRVFRVFRKQQQGRRTRSLDLSSSFREQRLEQKAEAKAQSDDQRVYDETEDVTPHLTPITEEAAGSLDPVTERLMVLMREKGQR
jgi:predicted RNA-binding Zn ribbon-like protein